MLPQNGIADPQNGSEVLAAVLAACILLITLCSFAAIVLLVQQCQRSSSNDVNEISLPIRRVSKPVAVTTQYRPLSDVSRRNRGEQHPRHPATTRSGSSSPRPILSTAPAAALAPFPPAASISQPSNAGDEPSEVVETSASLPARDSVAGSGGAGSRQQRGSSPIDSIDINLLSRIDVALASGVMRPEQATRILKSYGCDLEDLMKEELQDEGGSRPGLSSTVPPPPLQHVPSSDRILLPRDRGPSPHDSKACFSHVHSSGVSSGPQPALTSQQPERSRASSGLQLRLGSEPLPEGAAPLSDGGGGGAGVGGRGSVAGPVVDDVLLLKIDRALANGYMRPDQATQLLKSYGCDLEELLREELGEDLSAAGSSAQRSPRGTLSA